MQTLCRPPQRALNIRSRRNRSRHDPVQPENFSTWLVDWSLVTGNTMPPRDPNDDDDDYDDDDEDAEPDDEPTVIREPDE
jgi:hypothetical protein